MNIIKSLPVASRLNPGLADDLEVFFRSGCQPFLLFTTRPGAAVILPFI